MFTPYNTKLSQMISWYFDLCNTQKEVRIHTTHNHSSQNVLKSTIWPPKMNYLLLTSHYSDFYSGQGLASAADYYRQLALHSKTFPLG